MPRGSDKDRVKIHLLQVCAPPTVKSGVAANYTLLFDRVPGVNTFKVKCELEEHTGVGGAAGAIVRPSDLKLSLKTVPVTATGQKYVTFPLTITRVNGSYAGKVKLVVRIKNDEEQSAGITVNP